MCIRDRHITENVHEPIISRSDFETVQRILENAPVKRPNGDGEIHPLSGFKIAAADNRLMHIFCDVPLTPVYIVVMFISEMLCGLEVDHIAAILQMCIRDRGMVRRGGCYRKISVFSGS